MPDIRNRDDLERQLQSALTRAYAQGRRVLLAALYEEGMTTRDLANVPLDVLGEMQSDVVAAIQPILRQAYQDAAREFSGAMGYGLDDTQLNEQAVQWSSRHTNQLVSQLFQTTVRQLQQTAQQAENVPLTQRGLNSILLGILSVNRVVTTALTEITNAVSAGENFIETQLTAQQVTVEKLWFTRLDERVCPVCAPRHAKPEGTNWQLPPPAHPRCRCYLGYRITSADGTQRILFDDEQEARRLRRR